MADEIQINEKVVERLKRWIILQENQNIKTKKKGDGEMIKAIRNRIEEEVNAVKKD